MLTDEQIYDMARILFRDHKLDEEGWTFIIQDKSEKDHFGYTDFCSKIIEVYRQSINNRIERNIRELLLHEIAHALVGHGEHDLEWWDKYTDIGGKGVWIEPDAKIKRIEVHAIY